MKVANLHRGETILIVSHGDTIAHGLFELENPFQGGTTTSVLNRQGKYPRKGELVVLRVFLKGVQMISHPKIEDLDRFIS